MRAEDRCPSTGRACRNSACERGGCVKMRAGTPAAAAERPAAAVQKTVGSDAHREMAQLREEAAAAVAARTALEAVLDEAIAALELSDAALTYLQQSLGVKSSPRLEQLRQAKAKLRGVLRACHAAPAKTAAESEPAESPAEAQAV